MSRYETKQELLAEIDNTIRTGYGTGDLPRDRSCYSMVGVIRDLAIIGDRTYGYTMQEPGTPLADILRKNRK